MAETEYEIGVIRPKKEGPVFLKKFSRYTHMCPKKRARPKKRTQLALPLYYLLILFSKFEVVRTPAPSFKMNEIID
jgi:hypothetical protein